MTNISRSELFELAYRYYPRGVQNFSRIHVPPGEVVYDDTPEHLRLVEAAKRGKEEFPTWKAMTRRIGDRYSLEPACLSLLMDWALPAYSARVWLAKEAALTFHVSLLGPYYGIHLADFPGEEPIANDIAREIEATYPGYQTIPPEIGNEIVPDVDDAGASYGKATIYTSLFSEVWNWGARG